MCDAVHLTEIKEDRDTHPDEEINRSGRGIVACERERGVGREYTGSRGQQCPHSGLVHTGALLNSVAFRWIERERRREHAREKERQSHIGGARERGRRTLNVIYIIRARVLAAHAVWHRSLFLSLALSPSVSSPLALERLSSAVSEAAAEKRSARGERKKDKDGGVGMREREGEEVREIVARYVCAGVHV